MNTTNEYRVFDSRSKLYQTPFFETNHDTATRQFSLAINNSDGMFGKYPEDFTLFHTGTCFHELGKTVPLPTPESVIQGVHLVRHDEETFDPNLGEQLRALEMTRDNMVALNERKRPSNGKA